MSSEKNGAKTQSPEILKKNILGHPISLEFAPPGSKIPITERIDNKDEYVGSSEFEALVNFGQLFVERGMWDSRVVGSEMWTVSSPPPEGITILEFSDSEVKDALAELSMIARRDFYKNKSDCLRYYHLTNNIYDRIARHRPVRSYGHSTYFLGLIRAGVIAGEMLGFSVEEQVLMHTKRLHLKGEHKGDIAIGITPHFNSHRLKEAHGEVLTVGDPAGATLGSIFGNLLYMEHLGIRPKKVNILNTVVSHRGAEFALAAIKSLGIDVEITAGGYSPGMNERYYLETVQGYPSVGDAGDALDGFLPLSLRLLTYDK